MARLVRTFATSVRRAGLMTEKLKKELYKVKRRR